MFDSVYIQPPRAPSAQRIVVEEKKAPTDESVRLLKEMQTAAEQQIIATVRLDRNVFGGVVNIIERIYDRTTSARAVFDLNGRRHTAEVSVDTHDLGQDVYLLAEKLRAEIIERLADQITADLFQKVRL